MPARAWPGPLAPSPSRATRSTCTATAQSPTPAILTTNGFGGSKDDQADLGRAFAERGYVVLSYSGLGFGGFGGSDCKISLDDPDYDGKAAQQLVTYLGGGAAANDGSRIDYVRTDPTAHDGVAMAHDPRVAMIGGSYGGQVQLAVAGIDPPVDTIVPIITRNDLAYSLAPNNTDIPDPVRHGVSYDTPGSEKVGWTSLFFGVGIADGIQCAGTDPTRNIGCPNFIGYACVAKAQMDALGYPTAETIAFARHASVTSYVDRIRIPTLLVQGEDDTLFNLQEAIATYRALQAQGTETKMIWQSWGHSVPALPRGQGCRHRPGGQLLPQLGRLQRHRHPCLRHVAVLPGRHHPATAAVRRRRPGHQQGRRRARQCDLRQPGRGGAAVLQRGLRPAGRPGPWPRRSCRSGCRG